MSTPSSAGLPALDLQASQVLPADPGALLVGRAWLPAAGGPAVVTLRGDQVFDITSREAPTVRDLFEAADPAALAASTPGRSLGSLDSLLRNSDEASRDLGRPWLLSPVDLQAVKAAGVTFASSLLERLIEEQSKGVPERAAQLRRDMIELIGTDLARLVPGSEQAEALKRRLMERAMWSQYLEVGIGPDPEIFTKAQPLSSVGLGAHAGIHPRSRWNNPEPEVALVLSSAGRMVGATLANDVNLRDFEGRSALLLGMAKDNNASCAIGPFVRVFDANWGELEVEALELSLRVVGTDGFVLEGSSSMARISRPPRALADALLSMHQYPDGAVLLLGTLFAPIQDREAPGQGFTHHTGDVVTIRTPGLGALCNRVMPSDRCAPWSFGAGELMRNLAARGLLS
jgi:fumarylacetoacetate (FAA) hydrolase family protein